MKNRKMAVSGTIMILFVFLLLTVCEPFESSEYRIPADQTLEILNIDDPQYIHSSKTSVAKARIESGGIIISSVGHGGTVVFVSDSSGLSNSALIITDVANNGKITVKIRRFDESTRIRAVVKENVSIEGVVGNAISPSLVYLLMDNTHFIADYDMDASSWITNLPLGLSGIITYVQGGEFPHEVKITVSGTPQSAYSSPLAITIPKENTPTGWEIYVETRTGAQFAITDN
jgi:hypothetical protein